MISFSLALRRAAAVDALRIATQFEGRTHDWTATLEHVRCIAGALREAGLRPADRVAIYSSNSDFYFQAFFAVPWAGGIVVPINTRLAPTEIIHWLNDSECRFLFVQSALRSTIEKVRDSLPHLECLICIDDDEASVGHESLPVLLRAAGPVEDAGRCDDDLAALFYTGGTSGRSKGVMLTHRGLLVNVMQWCLATGVSSDDTILIAAPMFHMVAGLNSIAAAMHAATLAIVPKFDALAVLRAIEAYRVTKIALVPAMLDSIVSHAQARNFDLGSLQRISYGGAPMPEPILRRALALMPRTGFYQIYGQTEGGPNIAVLTPRHHDLGQDGPSSKLNSAGKPLPGVEISIRDIDDRAAAVGERGEICVRGPTISPGYWNLPEESRTFLRGGWAHTGDVGYLDQDGFLFIVDRLKDMIISGGSNIYSAEVEQVLYLHPGVAECAVIGIPHDHWGEQVHAVVRLHPEIALGEASIVAFCRQHLAGYKCVRSVEFRTTPLPRNAANKILKRELRDPHWVGRHRAV